MNRYIATGRLVSDPELRTFPSGKTVCKIRIAVEGLKRNNEVGYLDVDSYGAGGEAAAKVLSKGWLVSIDGRLEYHDWEADDGTKRQGWTVVSPIEFLAAPRSNGSDPAADQDASSETDAAAQQPTPAKSTGRGKRAAA